MASNHSACMSIMRTKSLCPSRAATWMGHRVSWSSLGFSGGKWWMRWGKIWWYNLVGGFYHLEKYERQWEGLSHILWKIKNVWNHQPVVNIWWGYHGDKWSYPALLGYIWKWEYDGYLVFDQESMAIEWEYEGDATNKSFSGVDNALPYSNLNHSWKVKHQLCTKKKNLRFYSEDYLSVTLHK